MTVKSKYFEAKEYYYKVLLICIFVLLISCIVTLNYQTNLVHKNDKIFDALYYNYYQRNYPCHISPDHFLFHPMN